MCVKSVVGDVTRMSCWMMEAYSAYMPSNTGGVRMGRGMPGRTDKEEATVSRGASWGALVGVRVERAVVPARLKSAVRDAVSIVFAFFFPFSAVVVGEGSVEVADEAGADFIPLRRWPRLSCVFSSFDSLSPSRLLSDTLSR